MSPNATSTDERSTGSDDVRVGQLIQRKDRLTHKLCAGEMGDVYAAQHLAAKKSIAVKVYHPALSQHPEFADAMRELMNVVRALGKNAPEIVTVYDCDVTEDGSVFVAMELVSGPNLAEVLRVEHPLKIERAVHLAGQIAGALASAHLFGIVHGDVRPSNVIITNGDPPLKLVGFDRARLRDVAPAALLDRAGVLPPRYEYRAPEQIRDEAVTALADVYGLGVLFYEMLTARLPFTAANAEDLKAMHLSKAPAPLRSIRADVPQVIEGKVLHALEKDPARRQNHVKDLVNEYLYDAALYFEAAQQEAGALDLDDDEESVSVPRAKLWRRVALIAGMVIILTIAGLWTLMSLRDSEPPDSFPPPAAAVPPAPAVPVSAGPNTPETQAPGPAPPQADKAAVTAPVPAEPPEQVVPAQVVPAPAAKAQASTPPRGASKVTGTAKPAKKTARTATAPTGPPPAGPSPAAQPSAPVSAGPARGESQEDPGAVIDWLMKKPLGGR